jgi:hypothetical protein
MRIAFLIPVVGLAACSGGSGSTLSVSTKVAASGAASTGLTAPSPSANAFTIGTHVTLDRARVLIRKVELEKEGSPDTSGSGDTSTPTTTTSTAAADPTSSGEGGESAGSDGSTEVRGGPYVIDLAGPQLDGGVVFQFDAPVAAGTYDEGTFQVHRLTPGQSVPDADFVPDGHSIILALTVDGVPYTFTSDITAVAEIAGPITVPTDGTANVTVTVDPSGWFTAPDGSYLDPTLEANRQQIEWNIKASIHGFEDDNRDGTPDH